MPGQRSLFVAISSGQPGAAQSEFGCWPSHPGWPVSLIDLALDLLAAQVRRRRSSVAEAGPRQSELTPVPSAIHLPLPPP